MKILITTLLAVLIGSVYGQNFQGKIVYQNIYTSKILNLTSEQLNSLMGTTQTYIIKEGNYKSSSNGTLFQWQLYINKDNKIYNKMSNSETILWNDGATITDKVLSVELNKGATKVLGYKCDEVILSFKSGTQKYYFNSKLGVDISLFTGHQFGNWYDFLKISKALPLKSIIDNEQFTLTSIAIEIKELKLDDIEFQLPINAKTEKNPY